MKQLMKELKNLASELKNIKNQIHVATSDYTEQMGNFWTRRSYENQRANYK